jgi:hypothetical protein
MARDVNRWARVAGEDPVPPSPMGAALPLVKR